MTLPSVVAPGVEIELGGRVRKLRMDLGAMALIDEQIGVNLINSAAALQNPSPRNIEVMVWACLVADSPDLEDPTVGRKLVASWIDLDNIFPVIQALTQSFHVAVPAPGAATPNGADPKNPRRG